MRLLAAVLTFFAFAASASAQSVVDSPGADETRLTIYPDNLAMVTEVRKVKLPKGDTTLRLFGVSDQIIPQTVVLQEFEGFSIEQNFTSDLLSKGSLLANAIGETVTIARVNPATGKVTRDEATLISAAYNPKTYQWQTTLPVQGAVFEIDGGFEALECSGLGEAIAFRRMPENLQPTPVLSIDVSSETAGEAEFVVSYLSAGISWNADYRVDVNKTHDEGAMLGWLTVTNSTAKTFKEVETAIVAGDVNRRGETNPKVPERKTFQARCWPKGSTKTGTRVQWPAHKSRIGGVTGWDGGVYDSFADVPAQPVMEGLVAQDAIVVTGARMAKREDLGDYKLYRTPQPVTVAAHQTKQVAFLSVADAELERLFKFDFNFAPSTEPHGATVQYEIDNSKEGNLAQPLPKGTVRVMTQRQNGRVAYLGEDSVENLAVDLPVQVEISTSPSVLSSQEITGLTNAIPLPTDHTLRLSGEIFNANAEKVTAEIKLQGQFIRAHNISGSSHAGDEDEIIPTFDIAVAAESSQKYEIDLPIERVFTLSESDIEFSKNVPGQKTGMWADTEYRLAGQYGGVAWPTQYFDEDDDNVKLTSELLSYEMATTSDNPVDLTVKLRHSFKSEAEKTVVVRFVSDGDEQRGLDAEIIDPTFPPISEDPVIWAFKLEPGEVKTLEYTKRVLSGNAE